MTSPYPMNRFAPDYFQGINTPPGSDVGYEPKPFTYIYEPPGGALTQNQILNNDSLQIDNDSDFILFGWYISLFTFVFQVRLTDATGYRMSSGFINSGTISQASSNPTVFSPSHPFPAGGKMIIDIQDLSGQIGGNPVQIAFVGEKLFRVKKG